MSQQHILFSERAVAVVAEDKIRGAIARGEFDHLPGLGQLMNLNQMLLSGLHVSTEAIERACQVARDAGALGAKLTGAGGGGCIVALADLDPGPVLSALRGAGFECFATQVRPEAQS